MIQDKISIIVPVYNAENTIERCIKSIVECMNTDIEIILVDDCSKDNSVNICKKLKNDYSFIKLYQNLENKGVSYTRNVGLKNASGDYILFIDSDDYVENNYINTFMECLLKYPKSFIVCGYINDDMKYNQTKTNIVLSENQFEIGDIKDLLVKLFNHNLLQQLWNKVFIKEIIDRNNIAFDETINVGEDFKFILDYLKYSNELCKLVMINKPLYHYMRDQSDSLMYNINYVHYSVAIENIEKMYSLCGLDEKQINNNLCSKKKDLINTYSYLIFHNKKMSYTDKKNNILKLDDQQGKNLFKRQRTIYFKEKIVQILNRRHIR